jgi:hypothetical protein
MRFGILVAYRGSRGNRPFAVMLYDYMLKVVVA